MFWLPHIDGLPFRKLGDENGLTGGQAYNRALAEINQLPLNFQITQELCDMARFSGILVLDGKYAAVKGFDDKIPFIYGIDYLTHDIPHGKLFISESEAAFSQYFHALRAIHYPLQIVIADDRGGLKQALNKVFPDVRLQLCHNHYLENIRQLLRYRTEEKYRHFFNSLKLHVFQQGVDDQTINAGWKHVWKERTNGSGFLQEILKDIDRRRVDLFNYLYIPNSPNNTNLIELYNSHLQARLKSIKGFQSFQSAERWLNAYVIRRRTKPLTDCRTKFKHLNKYASLEFTIKKQALWPGALTKLGIKKVKFSEKSG